MVGLSIEKGGYESWGQRGPLWGIPHAMPIRESHEALVSGLSKSTVQKSQNWNHRL